ncbi:Flap endonuclease 1 [Halotydeus destructor]|nr:Flap endonuclease 1 [Halotydeus destructor]
MDGLTFGAPRLIRNLSSGFQEKVKEFELAKALEGMELTQDEFIDLCILLGCDYCGSIRGVGPKTGLDLMRKFRSIESILTEKYKITDFAEVEVDYAEKIREPEPTVDAEVKTEENVDALNDSENVKPENGSGDEENKPINSDSGNDSNDSHPDIKTQKVEDAASEDDDDKDSDTKEGEEEEEEEASTKKKKKGLGKGKKDDAANVPENWLFRGARKLFVDPNVQREAIKESDLKQKDLDEEGLIKFLCEEHGFSEDRVRSGIKRIRAAKGKSAQSRIDTFFRTVPKSPAKDAPSKGKKVEAGKRKAEKSSAAGKRGRKGK